MSDSLIEWQILKTFREDLDGFKLAPLSVQKKVGKEVLDDVTTLAQLTPANLKVVLPQLREKYKKMRHEAIANGAINEKDPYYAYAAISESINLAIGRDQIFALIMSELNLWLESISVLRR